MRGALDVHRELLARGVPHEMVRLRRPVLSADDLPASLDLPARSCVAVRCYVAGDCPDAATPATRATAVTTVTPGADGATGGRWVAAMVHAGVVPDPVALLDAVGARSLRAATGAEVNAVTDSAAGLVSPVGLPAEVALLADAALGEAEVLYCATGEGGVALGVRTHDLLRAVGPRVASLSGTPLTEAERAGWDGVVALADVIDLDARTVTRRARRGGR